MLFRLLFCEKFLHNILGYVAYKVPRNDSTKNIQFMVYQLLWYVMLIKYQSQLTYVKVSDHDSKIEPKQTILKISLVRDVLLCYCFPWPVLVHRKQGIHKQRTLRSSWPPWWTLRLSSPGRSICKTGNLNIGKSELSSVELGHHGNRKICKSEFSLKLLIKLIFVVENRMTLLYFGGIGAHTNLFYCKEKKLEFLDF